MSIRTCLFNLKMYKESSEILFGAWCWNLGMFLPYLTEVCSLVLFAKRVLFKYMAPQQSYHERENESSECEHCMADKS